jgi:hypothetical protein
MALLPDDLRAKLEENGRRQRVVKETEGKMDFAPLARLYTPLADSIWLLTEIDPKDPDRAFGLHDPGKGSAELCYVSLKELERRFAQSSVRRDKDFHTNQPLSVYARKAGVVGKR